MEVVQFVWWTAYVSGCVDNGVHVRHRCSREVDDVYCADDVLCSLEISVDNLVAYANVRL